MNDGLQFAHFRQYCQCPECKPVDDAEGSPSGSLLKFVNAVAEAIEPEAPNVRIDTLAYQYTRKPPKTIRPRRNVIVRLCSIECCFGHPLEGCTSEANRRFRSELLAWEPFAPHLDIWDYTTDFGHYLQPFPNFDSLQANVRFFVKHGVTSLFEEGNTRLRVQIVRLPVWYVKLANNRATGDARMDLLRRFIAIARQGGITEISESGPLDKWAKGQGLE